MRYFMTLYLKGYQKWVPSKIQQVKVKSSNFIKSIVFLKSLYVKGHIVPHWKALRYGKDDSREKSCGSILNIHQDGLKSGNILQ